MKPSIFNDPDFGKPWLPGDLAWSDVEQETYEHEEESELTNEDGTPAVLKPHTERRMREWSTPRTERPVRP